MPWIERACPVPLGWIISVIVHGNRRKACFHVLRDGAGPGVPSRPRGAVQKALPSAGQSGGGGCAASCRWLAGDQITGPSGRAAWEAAEHTELRSGKPLVRTRELSPQPVRRHTAWSDACTRAGARAGAPLCGRPGTRQPVEQQHAGQGALVQAPGPELAPPSRPRVGPSISSPALVQNGTSAPRWRGAHAHAPAMGPAECGARPGSSWSCAFTPHIPALEPVTARYSPAGETGPSGFTLGHRACGRPRNSSTRHGRPGGPPAPSRSPSPSGGGRGGPGPSVSSLGGLVLRGPQDRPLLPAPPPLPPAMLNGDHRSKLQSSVRVLETPKLPFAWNMEMKKYLIFIIT